MPFAPRKLINPQKAAGRQWLALIDAQSSLDQLQVGHGLQRALHETGTDTILAGHMRDRTARGLLANHLAQPHRRALASATCTIRLGEREAQAPAPEPSFVQH